MVFCFSQIWDLNWWWEPDWTDLQDRMNTPDVGAISTSLLLRLLLLFLFPELNEAKHTQHLLNDADDNRHYPKTDPPPRLSSTLPMCLQNIVLYLRRVQLNNTHSDVQLLLFSLKHRSVCSLFSLSAAHTAFTFRRKLTETERRWEQHQRHLLLSLHPSSCPSFYPSSILPSLFPRLLLPSSPRLLCYLCLPAVIISSVMSVQAVPRGQPSKNNRCWIHKHTRSFNTQETHTSWKHTAAKSTQPTQQKQDAQNGAASDVNVEQTNARRSRRLLKASPAPPFSSPPHLPHPPHPPSPPSPSLSSLTLSDPVA